MRKSMLILPVALSVAGALVLAGPASAADTDVTVTVTGGTLSISAPAAAVSLGTFVASVESQQASAQLGNVTVTDNRGGIAGWTAAAGASAFSDGPSAGLLISYTTPTAVVTGATATVTPADSADLFVSSTVQTASAVSGAHAAVWNPTVTVTLPAGARVGTYTSTITHSVS